MGIVNVDTSKRITKFKFADTQPEEDYDPLSDFVFTNIKLINLVLKAKGWKQYDKEKDERYFEIKKPNGEILTAFVKNDLKDFSIHEILTMMKIDGGEITILAEVRSKKIKSSDIQDNLSM